MNFWLLTKEGILDPSVNTIASPIGNRLVHHGRLSDDKSKVAVIVDRTELWVYEINQETWSKRFTTSWEMNCLVWVGDKILVGTEKARLAWANDNSLDFITSFDQVEGRSKWNTPWGGPPDVRSLAVSANGQILANIHVGWIVTSEDGGMTWVERTKNLHKDVHHVNAHPSRPYVITCATAGGLHISYNGGESFEKRWDEGKTYQRTTEWLESSTGDVLLVSVSWGPSGSGSELWRSADDGMSWQQVDVPVTIGDNINTYQITPDQAGNAYVIIDNSTIIVTSDSGESWDVLLENLPKTYQFLVLPVKQKITD